MHKMKIQYKDIKSFFIYIIIFGIISFRAPTSLSQNIYYDESNINKIYTIDIRITEDIAFEEIYSINFDYPHIREKGFIIQMYYSNSFFGQSQWTPFRDISGIYIHSNDIQLPIKSWTDAGLGTSGNSWVRLVIITSDNI